MFALLYILQVHRCCEANLYFSSHCSRAGRSKQAASKENESSEEMDVFQSGSPVSDDIPQEEVMEEEEVSTINVREMPEFFFVSLCGVLCIDDQTMAFLLRMISCF